MANTYADYTATSGQTDFAFTFPYLKDTHVIVSIDGTDTDINDTGAGSFTIVTSPSTLVRLDSGATAGANVRVKRNSLGKSNTEPALVDYNDGSVLTEKDLDDAYLHNFYLSQEAVEGAAGGMSLDSSNTSWDAQNKKIINVNDPTNTKDAANKTYVDTQINNTVTGSTTEAQKWTFTGDNTATEFTFSPAITLDADTAYTVAIDGVMQEPTTAYTIDADNDTITFTSAPPTSSNIVVIARGYSVPVTEGAGTVTSVTAGNGLSGGTITTSGTVSIPTSGGDLNINSGKVGIGGDADSAKALKVSGDVLINETSGDTQLHILNQSSTNACSLKLEADVPYIQFKDTNASANTQIFNIGNVDGKIQLLSYNDDLSLKNTLYSFYSDGNIKLDSLPTTDPSTAGYLWNDGGVVSVSGSSGFSGGVSKYDSGYVNSVGGTALAPKAELTFTHNLSTTAALFQAWVATDSSGSDAVKLIDWESEWDGSQEDTFGCFFTNCTNTQITVTLAKDGLVVPNVSTTSGYDKKDFGSGTGEYDYIRLIAIG